MRVIYIAHPIRDERGPYWMVQNIRAAEAIALELWRAGAAAICPGKNTFLFDGALPDDTWLAGDLEIIDRCDAIVMAPGWRRSSGATREREKATDIGIPVFEWESDRDRLMAFISGAKMIALTDNQVVRQIVQHERDITDHERRRDED